MTAKLTAIPGDRRLSTPTNADTHGGECEREIALEAGEAAWERREKSVRLGVAEMTYLDHEQIRILILDTKNRVVENITRYQGTVNSSVLRAAEIFRPAIIRNCPAVIVCHNHPSGDPTPSPEDRPQVTRYFIGISPEKGFFINPALLAAHAPDAAA